MKNAFSRLAGSAVLAVTMMLSAPLAVAAQTAVAQTTGPAGAPVPAAWDYVKMTPEQRYALRMQARRLPPEERQQHNKALRIVVDSLPAWLHEALHDERTEWDCREGTVAPIPTIAPITDIWAYVKRLPTERYEFRMRARALPPEQRAVYDARLAEGMATLPPWLRQALDEEAQKLDAHYGLEQCPVARH